MNLIGVGFGIFALAVIGLGFFWVIRLEYHLGWLWWPMPMALGLVMIVASAFAPTPLLGGAIGVIGASLVWGSTELKTQAVRAELGWFPFNPRPKPAPPGVAVIRRFPPPNL